MTLADFGTVAVIIVGGGGIAGAVVALLKVRPEAGQIAVSASQGALVVASGVIDELQEENKRLRDRLSALETEMNNQHKLTWRVYELEQKLAHLEAERSKLLSENEALRERVRKLEENNNH